MTARLLTALGLLIATAFVGGCVLVGEIAMSPQKGRVGAPPAGLTAEAVTVPVPAREPLAGWYVDAPPGAPAVVLVHGYTDTRRQMIGRAEFLAEAGYAVLLFDLPAHGESRGERVTFGLHERHAVSAAVDYVRRRRPMTRVGVLGVSLGAASAAMAGRHLEADALVLDEAFATFEATVRARARWILGPLSPPAEAALVAQIRPRLGVPADSIRPAAALAESDQPTFVIGGTADRRATPDQSQALFDAAPGPKELWMVEGAKHEDLLRREPEAYPARVLAFFDAHLRPG